MRLSGAVLPGRRVRMSGGLLTPYAKDHLLLVGTSPAPTAATADAARVLVATVTPGGVVGTPRALPGTTRHQLYAAAGGPDGTVAWVTGSITGHRERVVWIRRGGVNRRALTIRVGSRARGATVAVGPKGDVLVVYEDDHRILSRHIGRTGRAQPARRLGDGVQSHLEARVAPSGRLEVAWASQRVNEGEVGAPAVVSYVSAAPGHGFGRPTVVAGPDAPGEARYAAPPVVRLVGSGSDSSVLAFTTSDGPNLRTAVANVVAGRVQAPELVSPAGEDDVLGDLAYARTGGTLVLWRTGSGGDFATGPQRLVARFRPAGAAAFGPAEGVSPPVASPADPQGVPSAPAAAIDPLTGRAATAWGTAGDGVAYSARGNG